MLVEQRQVRGVRLASGMEVVSNIVVSNTDPKRTLLQLTDPEWVSPELRRRASPLTASKNFSRSVIDYVLYTPKDLETGLYLCGAGMHSWGEVNGAPGHNAAHAVLEDAGD